MVIIFTSGDEGNRRRKITACERKEVKRGAEAQQLAAGEAYEVVKWKDKGAPERKRPSEGSVTG